MTTGRSRSLTWIINKMPLYEAGDKDQMSAPADKAGRRITESRTGYESFGDRQLRADSHGGDR